jgi:hypothetical protein
MVSARLPIPLFMAMAMFMAMAAPSAEAQLTTPPAAPAASRITP